MSFADDRIPLPPGYPSDSPNMHFTYTIYEMKKAPTLYRIVVKDPAKPDTRLDELSDSKFGQQSAPKPAMGEDSRQAKLFEFAVDGLSSASDNVAGDMPQKWDLIRKSILAAKMTFKKELSDLDSGPDPWIGKARDAVQENLSRSFHILETLAAGAGALSLLNDAFSRTLGTAKNDIVPNYADYRVALNSFPENYNDIVTQYDSFARNVIDNTYNPNITNIAKNNPGFNAGLPPAIDGTNGGLGTGPSGRGGGGPVDPNLAKLASAPLPSAPTIPNASQNPTGLSTPTTSPTSGAQDLSQLGSLAEGAAMPAQSVGSQLAGMAGQAANPGLRNAASLGKLPPEGTLGLGPKSPKGGGIGGGAGARGPAIGRSVGAPPTAAGTMAGRTVATGSRAGLSSAMGSPAAGAPGAGAPAAGQQGAAQGTQHQPNKALRRKKNGEELIGDAQAVVPVLGEPAQPEAAKREAT